MNFKTLLLGSAAVIASAAGSVQAADLSVAEPVDYVRVCDAFGGGYFYIPGSDTCLAISGYVEVGTEFGDNVPDSDEHDWSFYTTAGLNVDARSMTDWGPLVAFIQIEGKRGYFDETVMEVDEAYLSIGPLLLGYTKSIFDDGAGFTDDGLDLGNLSNVNQVKLSWAFNGFGLEMAIEEPTNYFGSSGGNIPVLTAAITAEAAGWDAKLAVFYGANDIDDTAAVMGDVETEIGMWQFSVAGIWVDGYGIKTWDDSISGEGWAVNLSMQQNWSEQFWTAQTLVLADMDGTDDMGAEFTAAYSPADSLWLVGTVYTEDEFDSYDFLLYAKKTFGPNG
jgi:hypothetical protein